MSLFSVRLKNRRLTNGVQKEKFKTGDQWNSLAFIDALNCRSYVSVSSGIAVTLNEARGCIHPTEIRNELKTFCNCVCTFYFFLQNKIQTMI